MTTTRRDLRPLLLALALALSGFSVVTTDAPPAQQPLAEREDADWSEHYLPSHDGVTQLHADVLRPKGYDLTAANPTPVILTVSPYTNHNGSTTDTDLQGEGPNPRFYDFLDLSGALERDYTYVMVDLPGFGGSGGCNDWGGEREQGAVRAAVEWAAAQPWSTGRVGLLGKSYDGWTGLMGINQQPHGLEAVVSLEPVYSGYRYIFMNGVRRPNWLSTIGLFQVIDAKPGRPGDSLQYQLNSAPQAWCYPANLALGADHRENADYWVERDLLATTAGKTTPLFLTQGFLETNTRPDGAFRYYNGLTGEQHRAWYGQFDHVRGWETTSDGRQHTGRDDFIAQVMRFFDEHLKGVEPLEGAPSIEVQDIQGRWRAEAAWPPDDTRLYQSELNLGTYTDDGSGSGEQPSADQGIWSISEPLPHEVWLAGEPVVSLGVNGVPDANVAVNVYDIAPDGSLAMISRGTSLVAEAATFPGDRNVSFHLYGQDWPIEAGHRIGVLVSDANSDEYLHVPTSTDVEVLDGTISLPFLTYDRIRFIDSDGTTPRLEDFWEDATATLDGDTIAAAETDFTLPAPLRPRPGPPVGTAGGAND